MWGGVQIGIVQAFFSRFLGLNIGAYSCLQQSQWTRRSITKTYSCLKGGCRNQGEGREALTVHPLLGTVFSLCFDSLLKSSSTFKHTESFLRGQQWPWRKREGKKALLLDVISKQCIKFTLSHELDSGKCFIQSMLKTRQTPAQLQCILASQGKDTHRNSET